MTRNKCKEIWRLLDEGTTNTQEIAQTTGAAINTVNTQKSLWKKSKQQIKPADTNTENNGFNTGY